MRRVLGRSFSLLLVVLLATLLDARAGEATSPGDPALGKARFEQYCAVCHGHHAQGDGPMAKATTPPAPSLVSPEVRKRSDQDLVRAMADGMGVTMPAWRGILSDQDLLDVAAYLRSLGELTHLP